MTIMVFKQKCLLFWATVASAVVGCTVSCLEAVEMTQFPPVPIQNYINIYNHIELFFLQLNFFILLFKMLLKMLTILSF